MYWMIILDYVLVAAVLERSLEPFLDPPDAALGKQVPRSYLVYGFYHVPFSSLLSFFLPEAHLHDFLR